MKFTIFNSDNNCYRLVTHVTITVTTSHNTKKNIKGFGKITL